MIHEIFELAPLISAAENEGALLLGWNEINDR